MRAFHFSAVPGVACPVGCSKVVVPQQRSSLELALGLANGSLSHCVAYLEMLFTGSIWALSCIKSCIMRMHAHWSCIMIHLSGGHSVLSSSLFFAAVTHKLLAAAACAAATSAIFVFTAL